MSQSNAGEDRFQRWLGIRPRGSAPISTITTPEIPGDPSAGLTVPAPHIAVHNPALPLSSPGVDTAPVPQAGAGRAVSGKSGAGSLWARALGSLSEKDKNTLETTETRSKLDIEELLAAVREKQEVCLRNQWEFEFRGRAVNLRHQADQIISWLAKFKEVGDIAIQHDPSHAALPWAGIRFLLQVGPAAFSPTGC